MAQTAASRIKPVFSIQSCQICKGFTNMSTCLMCTCCHVSGTRYRLKTRGCSRKRLRSKWPRIFGGMDTLFKKNHWATLISERKNFRPDCSLRAHSSPSCTCTVPLMFACTVSVCTWMGLRLGEFSHSAGSMEEEIHSQLFSA